MFIKWFKKLFRNTKQRKLSQSNIEHTEKDTECDLCEHKEHCVKNGYVVNCTTGNDMRTHYICGPGSKCRKKDEKYEGNTVSQVLTSYKALKDNADDCICVKIMEKILEQYGDIPFKEALEKANNIEI